MKTIETLLSEAGSPDPSRSKIAMEGLVSLAGKHTKLMLPYLNESRLIMRVCIESAFREAKVDIGAFDAWADAEERSVELKEFERASGFEG